MKKPRKLKMLSPIPRAKYNLMINKRKFKVISKYLDDLMINQPGVAEPFFKKEKI